MYIYKNEKYIIFLHDRFFKKSLLKSYYNKIVNNLENKGIIVVSSSDILKYQNTNNILTFDDKIYPDMNCLYIHLFNGRYYNDNMYVKKKIESEREMLTLLAGKLGVRELRYSSIITETSLSNTNALTNTKGINMNVKYTKNTTIREGTCGQEIYLNRGAPVYISSKNLEQVEENIKEKLGSMKSNIFSYDFYKHHPKLESFVYKRFEFKMQHLEYTIDVEDISEKSFEIRSCFMDYGIGLLVDRNTCYNETINYIFDFFTDEELRVQLIKNERFDSDDFIIIREAYDASKNKDLEVEYICEYVKMEASRCMYTTDISDKNAPTYNFQIDLYNWINCKPIQEFYDICHTFVSTMQIRAWLYKTFFNPIIETNYIRCSSTPNILNDDIIPEKLTNKIYKLSQFNNIQCLKPNKNLDNIINIPSNTIVEV